MFDYIKGRWPAVYFKSEKKSCISSLRLKTHTYVSFYLISSKCTRLAKCH